MYKELRILASVLPEESTIYLKNKLGKNPVRLSMSHFVIYAVIFVCLRNKIRWLLMSNSAFHSKYSELQDYSGFISCQITTKVI